MATQTKNNNQKTKQKQQQQQCNYQLLRFISIEEQQRGRTMQEFLRHRNAPHSFSRTQQFEAVPAADGSTLLTASNSDSRNQLREIIQQAPSSPTAAPGGPPSPSAAAAHQGSPQQSASDMPMASVVIDTDDTFVPQPLTPPPVGSARERVQSHKRSNSASLSTDSDSLSDIEGIDL